MDNQRLQEETLEGYSDNNHAGASKTIEYNTAIMVWSGSLKTFLKKCKMIKMHYYFTFFVRAKEIV